MKRKKIKQKLEQNKGISLVALVITIIILLVLVGITVTFLGNDNGIIQKAKIATETMEIKEIKENLDLVILDINYLLDTSEGTLHTLQKRGYINENYIVNVEKLIHRKGQQRKWRYDR